MIGIPDGHVGRYVRTILQYLNGITVVNCHNCKWYMLHCAPTLGATVLPQSRPLAQCTHACLLSTHAWECGVQLLMCTQARLHASTHCCCPLPPTSASTLIRQCKPCIRQAKQIRLLYALMAGSYHQPACTHKQKTQLKRIHDILTLCKRGLLSIHTRFR